jgi:hypothetical protein
LDAVGREVEVFLEAEGSRVGDVDAVEEGEEVEDAEEGDDAEVDSRYETALGGVGWADDVEFVIFGDDGVGVLRIVVIRVFETCFVVDLGGGGRCWRC